MRKGPASKQCPNLDIMTEDQLTELRLGLTTPPHIRRLAELEDKRRNNAERRSHHIFALMRTNKFSASPDF